MGWPMIAALCIAGGALLLFLLWVFLVAARPVKQSTVAPFLRPYAHRGLYGNGIPENSLPAFRRAAEAGFAIELDVQLSADGEVFVFHDYTLARMCGQAVRLSDIPGDVLRKTRLEGTEHCIPTLREVLEAVDGRVPLLIELKGESGDTSLCPRVAALLADYHGKWCVESFNPLLLRWFRRHCKAAVRGLLVTDLIKEKKEGLRLVNFALSAQWLNFCCRPAFLAWDHRYPGSLARKFNLTRGAASFVYTVKTQEEYKAQCAAGNFSIFEGFLPTDPFRPRRP